VGLSAIALIAFFVFAALTFERGGDDVAAVVLPL
jgi:hypothetical protein